jgi:hypothetical protein
MNSKKKWRELEVNEEDDDSKVDKSMWSWNPVGLFVEDKDDGSNEWSFCVAKKLN